MKLEAAAHQLEALGNPTRLRVYRILVRAGADGLPVGRLQAKIGIAASTLSHHLKRLVEAGLVTQLFNQWRSQQPGDSQAADASATPPTMDEMKRKLLETIRVEDDTLRALARSRAEQVQAQLVGDGKISEDRVFLTDVDLTPSDHDKVQSRLNITAGS